MSESQPSVDACLDEAGQVTPSANAPSKVTPIPPELEEARQTIDNIDAALIHILAERFRCTQRVGYIKAEHGLAAADHAREDRQVKRLRQLAHDSGLNPVFAEKFLRFIVNEVIRHHITIAEEKTERFEAQ